MVVSVITFTWALDSDVCCEAFAGAAGAAGGSREVLAPGIHKVSQHFVCAGVCQAQFLYLHTLACAAEVGLFILCFSSKFMSTTA